MLTRNIKLRTLTLNIHNSAWGYPVNGQLKSSREWILSCVGFASLDMYTFMLYTDEYTIEINSKVVNRGRMIKNLSLIMVKKTQQFDQA